MLLIGITTADLVANVGFLGSAIIAAFVLLKGWREFQQGETERLKIKEDAKVAIAKENSVGAEAVRKIREVENDFRKRIETLEHELEEGLHMAGKEREKIMQQLETVKKEHTDFINKSLEYFMGRKT